MAKTKPITNARTLRRTLTSAERHVWSYLRQRPEGLKFRRQHPIGPYIADFTCVEAKLVIELDGPSHLEVGAQEADSQRTAFIEDQGWQVIRFWNPQSKDEVDGIVSAIIEQAVARRAKLNP